MNSVIRVPAPRSNHPLITALRWVWTLPTSVIGHAVGFAVTGTRPVSIGSQAAKAWLYVCSLDVGAFRAVTIGNVIICASGCSVGGQQRRVILAHELSHVRQHHWLGPLYLPFHGIAQLISIGIWMVRPRAGISRKHAYNPLEETYICVPYSAIAQSTSQLSERVATALTAFGV